MMGKNNSHGSWMCEAKGFVNEKKGWSQCLRGEKRDEGKVLGVIVDLRIPGSLPLLIVASGCHLSVEIRNDEENAG
jgi:hypothetical protein